MKREIRYLEIQLIDEHISMLNSEIGLRNRLIEQLMIKRKDLQDDGAETVTDESNVDRNISKDAPKIVSESELCKYLNVSRITLYKWRKAGMIPFINIGGLKTIKYNLDDVLKALGIVNHLV